MVRVQSGAEGQGQEGHFLVVAAGGEGHGHLGADDHAAGLGMGVHLPALDDQVAGQQVGNHDAVEVAAQLTVIALQTGGLLGQDQVVGDGAHQIAVGDGGLGVLVDQSLGLNGVLHVEADLLHHGQQGDVGLLVAHGTQHLGHVPNNFFLLLQIGLDGNGDVADGDELGVLGHAHQVDVDEALVGAQVVLLVQQGHQEFTGLGVAAHEHVAFALVDQVDGTLHHVFTGLGGDQTVGLVLQPQTLQHGLDLPGLAHQNGGGETGVLSLEGAQQDVLGVGAGNNHALLGKGLLGALHDLIEVLQSHSNFSFKY